MFEQLRELASRQLIRSVNPSQNQLFLDRAVIGKRLEVNMEKAEAVEKILQLNPRN